MKSSLKPVTTLWLTTGASTLLLVVYAWIYWFEPLTETASEYINDKVLDVLTLAAALAAACLGILYTRKFKAGEPPRRVWLAFLVGWWCWVGGEIAGLVYDYFYWYVDYPEFTVIDIFWLLGYAAFSLSLFLQFRLIYSRWKKNGLLFFAAILAVSLLTGLALTELALATGLGEGYSWFSLYVAVLYPVFDVTEGLAALWLAFLFGRGLWSRPWWGLIAFAIADGIAIYFWIGGYHGLSDGAVNGLYLFSDILYNAGYLVVALAFLMNFLILRFGRFNASHRTEELPTSVRE